MQCNVNDVKCNVNAERCGCDACSNLLLAIRMSYIFYYYSSLMSSGDFCQNSIYFGST